MEEEIKDVGENGSKNGFVMINFQFFNAINDFNLLAYDMFRRTLRKKWNRWAPVNNDFQVWQYHPTSSYQSVRWHGQMN